jgi:hypothetical protein
MREEIQKMDTNIFKVDEEVTHETYKKFMKSKKNDMVTETPKDLKIGSTILDTHDTLSSLVRILHSLSSFRHAFDNLPEGKILFCSRGVLMVLNQFNRGIFGLYHR